MGIVNAGQLVVYDEIPKDLLERVEDVLLNRRADAADRLTEFAESVKSAKKKDRATELAWRDGTVAERLKHALITGTIDYIDADVEEARQTYSSGRCRSSKARSWTGMNVVGDLFGAGKMFLPQVVKSARVMKKAVAYLTPFMEAEKAPRPGRRKRLRLFPNAPVARPGLDGDRQGRRSRHRQEHRGRGARLQRLRNHRSRRDDSLRSRF